MNIQRLIIAVMIAGLIAGGEWRAHAGFDEGLAAFQNKDYATAWKELEPLAVQGHAGAQNIIGGMYKQGNAVDADLSKAAEWYEKSAAQGLKAAEYNLGLLYEFGHGVEKDVQKAITFFKRASDHPTYIWPQFRLGWIYEHGIGVPKDVKAALHWYNISAQRGYANAKLGMGRVLESLATSRKQRENALNWYLAAANGGNIEAKLKAANLRLKLQKEAPKQTVEEPVLRRADYPPAGPIVKYKGRTLIGSGYPKINNDAFFKSMKWAIDHVDKLPKKLRAPAELIREIRYNPPSKHRKRNDVYTNITGVYSVGPGDRFPAPVIIYRSTKWAAPLHFAYSLAGNGLRAQRHQRRLELEALIQRHRTGKVSLSAQRLKSAQREHDELLASLRKSDQRIVDKYECKSMIFRFELMKVWEKNSRRRDGLARQLSERQCW